MFDDPDGWPDLPPDASEDVADAIAEQRLEEAAAAEQRFAGLVRPLRRPSRIMTALRGAAAALWKLIPMKVGDLRGSRRGRVGRWRPLTSVTSCRSSKGSGRFQIL